MTGLVAGFRVSLKRKRRALLMFVLLTSKRGRVSPECFLSSHVDGKIDGTFRESQGAALPNIKRSI